MQEVYETNVLVFRSHLKRKQEQEESQQAEEYFINSVLPYLTFDDKLKLYEAQYNEKLFNNVLSRILRKIN